IADLLGLPRGLEEKIRAWSDAAVEPLGMMISDERLVDCAKLVKEFQDFIVGELETRKNTPRDDLLTHLVQARDESGSGLTTPEMLSLTQQFLVAGNETTTNGIAAAVQLLIDYPAQLSILQHDPSRVMTFVNEVLRLESPAQGLFRVVMEDTELAGVRMPAGSRIMLRFAAANRDASKYDEPDKLDVTRRNSATPVGFGSGIHHCIGANLAREEMVQTFEILISRITNLSFAEGRNDFTHHPSLILRGLKHLYINFDKISGDVV
ncbi:MAG: cytochrome P450, partial [Pseudomonadales bacterium]